MRRFAWNKVKIKRVFFLLFLTKLLGKVPYLIFFLHKMSNYFYGFKVEIALVLNFLINGGRSMVIFDVDRRLWEEKGGMFLRFFDELIEIE